ncbi:hypothetical protein [Leptolyngbya sp. FACHB-17]|uniref:hypothetical protein n=1 Tax=unclassified Leptolyngbya TaxID=2650499 RepID=UPI001681900F|nr:hypothetical protein [Leptolyngbya sp. FACHB-17]MBD2080388.1 hypothetical protein [Leptolyngbya sp. FACHB-17]
MTLIEPLKTIPDPRCHRGQRHELWLTRTQVSWGLSASAVCRLIQRVETLLLASGKFRLPGKNNCIRTHTLGKCGS